MKRDIELIYRDIIKKYIKKDEAFTISYPVVYKSKKYYEASYYKKILFIKINNKKGNIYFDENGNLVDEAEIIKNLSKLFYYQDFFKNNSFLDFKRIVKSKALLQNQIDEYSKASKLMEFFISQNCEGSIDVKRVIDEIPYMRVKAQEKTKEFIERVNLYKANDYIFDDNIKNELINTYYDLLFMNIERVKLIKTCDAYYDGIKKEIKGIKKGLKYKVNKKLQEEALLLDNIINYFINTLNYYYKIIDYTKEQYIEYLKQIENKNIEKNIRLIRNI